MNPFKETITNLMRELGENLHVGYEFINYFIPARILTMEEIDMIAVKEVQIAKNTVFLRIVMNKPEKEALRVLLEALRNTAQPHLAKKIEEEYARQTAAAGTGHSAQLPLLMDPPKFTVKPKDKDVKEGDKAEFHATSKGNPIPEITWFKGDELLKSTDRVTITSKKVGSDRTSTLTIHKATDSCELMACARNTAGEDKCTAKLRVASRFATHGSYLARDSGTVLHLCKVEGKWEDTVRAIRPAALLWPKVLDPPSVPRGVQVLWVGNSWEAVLGGLQDAESRGHKTVAVVLGWDDDIKRLSDHIAARRDTAATDVWLLWGGHTDDLSGWQWEMDEDSHYQCIK